MNDPLSIVEHGIYRNGTSRRLTLLELAADRRDATHGPWIAF